MVSSVFVEVSPSMVITVQLLMLSVSLHAQISLVSLTSRLICCVVLLWLSVCIESAISATSLQGRKQSIFSLICLSCLQFRKKRFQCYDVYFRK